MFNPNSIEGGRIISRFLAKNDGVPSQPADSNSRVISVKTTTTIGTLTTQDSHTVSFGNPEEAAREAKRINKRRDSGTIATTTSQAELISDDQIPKVDSQAT